jgi:hypothetical protein
VTDSSRAFALAVTSEALPARKGFEISEFEADSYGEAAGGEVVSGI